MRSLDNFFTQDIATQGGMSTQDTVTALVPLLEQLADLHDSDLVGPTDHFEKVFINFPLKIMSCTSWVYINKITFSHRYITSTCIC